MGSALVGVQCSLTSSLHVHVGEFLDNWAGSGILGYTARVGVHRLSLRLPYVGAFSHSLFFTSHWISIVFLLQGRCICTHSVDPSLTHFLGEFPGLGLAMEPDVVVPETEPGCAWSRNLNRNFCPGRRRTSDLGVEQ